MPIMIDLETLGSGQRAVVLSLGAVDFSYLGIVDREFCMNFSIKANFDLKREIDPETLEWWLKQSKEAQNSLFIPQPTHDIAMTLIGFSSWIKAAEEERPEIWANGVSFDFPILRSFMKDANVSVPWNYKQEMCLRPIRLIGKKIGANYSKDKNTAHDALEDARNQAKYLCEIFKRIGCIEN